MKSKLIDQQYTKINESGNTFDDFNMFQSTNDRITKIVVKYGTVIDSVQFYYGTNATKKYGGIGGDYTGQIEIGENDNICRLGGTYMSYNGVVCVSSLSFFIIRDDGGTATEYTFGTPGKDKFFYCEPDTNSRIHINSFFGYYDKYLNGIGVYCVPRHFEFIAYLHAENERRARENSFNITNSYRDKVINEYFTYLKQTFVTKEKALFLAPQWYWKTRSELLDENKKSILILAMLKFYDFWFQSRDIDERITSHGLLTLGKRPWQYKNMIVGDYMFPSVRRIFLKYEGFIAYNDSLEKEALNLDILPEINVGTGALPNVYPRFSGSGILNDPNYGLVSKETSDNLITINKAGVIKSICALHEWAIKQGIHILMLPEVCMDHDDLQLLKKLLSEKPGEIKVVLPGSAYIIKDNHRYNQAPIWILPNKEVIELYPYNKTIPFSMDIDTASSNPDISRISQEAKKAQRSILVEDIESGSQIRILRSGNIYIGIAVCRDVLDMFDNGNPLNRYCDFVDIMLVTSMNSGHTNLFSSTAENMARWHNCTTVYANNLTSVPNLDNKTVEISFCITPDIDKAAGIKGELYYRTPPIVNNADALVFDKCIESIYSEGVKAMKLPENGNVMYTVTRQQ